MTSAKAARSGHGVHVLHIFLLGLGVSQHRRGLTGPVHREEWLAARVDLLWGPRL
jgi:hypothetical protein